MYAKTVMHRDKHMQSKISMRSHALYIFLFTNFNGLWMRTQVHTKHITWRASGKGLHTSVYLAGAERVEEFSWAKEVMNFWLLINSKYYNCCFVFLLQMNSPHSVEVKDLASSLTFIQDYQLVSCNFYFELDSVLPLPREEGRLVFPIIFFMGGIMTKQCSGVQPSV